MNFAQKLVPGSIFPVIELSADQNNNIRLGQPNIAGNWQLVVVYRGVHCPLCTQYLNQLEGVLDTLQSAGIEVVAVSADALSQYNQHKAKLNVSYPIGHGLTIEQMTSLGLYISSPRSPQETDHEFSEPALFVVNDEGVIQMLEYSNNPFIRPDLNSLVGGLNWAKQNHYPIRGRFTHS